MDNELMFDLIYDQMDVRGPVQLDTAELDDPIGDALTKMRLDFLAKSVVPLPIHVVPPTIADIIGDSGLTLEADVPLTKHVEVEPEEMTLRKSAELSDEDKEFARHMEASRAMWGG